MPTPRKTAPRATRTKTVKSAVDTLPDAAREILAKPIEPVVIGKRARSDEELVTIFHLDGKDYKIPAKPGPAIMIKYMRDARKIGEAQAGFNVLNAMLGDEALEALAESDDVTEADLNRIYEIVTKVFFEGMTGFGEVSGN
jgi:hypothetical protein